jgi:acyl transferase domain-containing protein
VELILNTAAFLWSAGTPVDLQAVQHLSSSTPDKVAVMSTEIPPYDFNHLKSFWGESRLSKNVRQRQFPRHDLFGAPVSDWNPSEPKWKNFIRRSELPWVIDHQVSLW